MEAVSKGNRRTEQKQNEKEEKQSSTEEGLVESEKKVQPET